MNNRVLPDFSVQIRCGEDLVLMNRVYDNIHIFDWLGHGILKIVCETGFLQWHTSQAAALEVAQVCGITPVYRQDITEIEHEQYLRTQESFLNESDFGLDFDTPPDAS